MSIEADLVYSPWRTGSSTGSIDRVPPHSEEAEQGVISCILQAPMECAPTCLEKLKAGGETFYDLRHRDLYTLLVSMYDERRPIDLITVHQALRDSNQIDKIGGVAYLNALVDAAPSHFNLDFYLKTIISKFILRRLIQVCAGAVARIYDHEGEVDQLLDSVETEIHAIRDSAIGAKDDLEWKELVRGAITTIEQYHQRQGGLMGIPSGFVDLDKMTDGFKPGEMIVIAGRPATGKTSVSMNIAEYIAVDCDVPVGVFSLEMTAESLAFRMLCSRARVNFRNIRDGFLVDRDFPKITSAAGKLARGKIELCDVSGLTVMELRARARRMVQRKGIKAMVIDYLQLMRGTGHKSRSREQEVAEISAGIKSLAKELSIPIIVLAQLNRESEKDKKRKPRLSDLRESGAIEQDADLVGILYNPHPLDDDEAESVPELDAIPVNLLIAKQRNGPTGDVHLTFFKNYTRFESAAKVSSDCVA